MFRPMRRKSKETDIDTAKQLLRTERRGVFAVNVMMATHMQYL